jgi:hypothetical protein
MKNIFTHISVTLLSLIVILSSMSFTVQKHYCGDILVEVSYLGKAKGCCSTNDVKHTENHENSTSKKKCCNDKLELIESSTFEKEKLIALSVEQLEFSVYFLFSYIDLFQQRDVKKEFYKDFSPPDIVQDIQLLQETFLI